MMSVVVTALLLAAIVAGNGALDISTTSVATQSATPAPIDEEDQDKLTPLMRASARGDLPAVKALLDKRAGPKLTDLHDWGDVEIGQQTLSGSRKVGRLSPQEEEDRRQAEEARKRKAVSV